METATAQSKTLIDRMFTAGAHYAYKKTRRHPSAKPFIFGTKGTVEIFNLEHTQDALEKAKEVLKKFAMEGKKILLVGSKHEAREAIRKSASELQMPYVVERWIGGTLTNFDQIKKRVQRLVDLRSAREKGEHDKYTKKERLMLEREMNKLDLYFGGLVDMQDVPKLLVIVDPKHEHTALREANRLNIPVIALSNSDCDLAHITYPIPANDANIRSITFFMEELTRAFKDAWKAPAKQEENKDTGFKKQEAVKNTKAQTS